MLVLQVMQPEPLQCHHTDHYVIHDIKEYASSAGHETRPYCNVSACISFSNIVQYTLMNTVTWPWIRQTWMLKWCEANNVRRRNNIPKSIHMFIALILHRVTEKACISNIISSLWFKACLGWILIGPELVHCIGSLIPNERMPTRGLACFIHALSSE